MSADVRILWIHKKIATNCYPNSSHVVEKFNISQRQAQRDIDSLKSEYGAPIKYSSARRGYYYTEPFELPSAEIEDTEREYIDIVVGVEDNFRDSSDQLQLRVPYTAELYIKDKLTVMNLRRFIVKRESKDIYSCEFYNVDSFVGLLFLSDADIKILKPEWLRDKMLDLAKKVIKNNEN